MAAVRRSFRRAPLVTNGSTAGRLAALLFSQLRSADRTAARRMALRCSPASSPRTRSPTPITTRCRYRWRSASLTACRLQVAYTFSKSFDQASSFEGELNPLDPAARTRSPSSTPAIAWCSATYWELPIPKYSGFAGKVLNGWDISGIYTYQTGFPIRITSSADNELMYSAFFEYPGEPDQLAPFHKLRSARPTAATGSIPTASPRMLPTTQPPCSTDASFNCFDPSLFGQIGNAKRTICCGPPINNLDFALHKVLPVSERASGLNSAPSSSTCSTTRSSTIRTATSTDGSDFGRIKRARDPRLIQFALKFYF